MTKKGYLLTFLLLTVTATSTLAQNTAQATMRVSVKIESGSSVTVEQPKVLSFSEGEKTALGQLILKGSEDMVIRNSQEVTLVNRHGEEVTVGITSKREENESTSDNISYEGLAESREMSSGYKGELTTTIEYF